MHDEPWMTIDLIIIWKPISALVLASLALMGSPGPATLSLAAVGAAYGSGRAIPYLIGIIIGTQIVLAAVATGLTGAILAVPGLGPVLITFAATYILYLAVKIATAPPLAARNSADSPPSFGGGLLLAIANPKAYAAIAAVFAGVTLDNQQPVLDAAMKFGVLAIMIALINTAWTALGAALSGLLYDPRKARAANVSFAVILVAATAVALL